MKILFDTARTLGASDFALIPASQIPVRPELADFCTPSGCPDYDTSANCPPHGLKPEAFRQMLGWYQSALVFRIQVKTEILSDETLRRPHLARVHEIAAALESAASRHGATLTAGVASGGCKRLFCDGWKECAKRSTGTCRHPGLAKPSMSGLGVDFLALCRKIGWAASPMTRATTASEMETGTLVGFVLFRF